MLESSLVRIKQARKSLLPLLLHFFLMLNTCQSFCCFCIFVGNLSRWLNVAEVLASGGIPSFVLNEGIVALSSLVDTVAVIV